MPWLITLIGSIIFFNVFPAGIAGLLSLGLLVWLLRMNQATRRQPEAREAMAGDEHSLNRLAFTAIRLTLLRQELTRLHASGRLAEDRYLSLCDALDRRMNALPRQLSEQTRRQLLADGWTLLDQGSDHPIGIPPWRTVPPVARVAPSAPDETAPVGLTASLTTPPVAIRPPPVASPVSPPPTVAVPASVTVPKPAVVPEPAVVSEPATIAEPATVSEPLPIRPPSPRPPPAPPSWLERSRAFIARVLMPFLWQNIGWFLGGFLFVAGSVFLVAYTSGFAKALVVLAVLDLYSLLLLVGAYQLRRRRPELISSSQVLTILGVLLVPLDLAAASRLLVAADTFGLGLLAVTLSLLTLVVFAIGVRLGSGLLDRRLSQEQPSLFILLAALQLALPLLIHVPIWPLLAVLHLALLGLLAYALYRFADHWLQALFVERHLLTGYAAGTLVYAALVSFIHLTWGSPVTLPAGYPGPFLMLLSGLLLYLDIRFQTWVQRYVWLGYFGFVVYALAVVAVVLAWPGLQPLRLTLALGTLLYGAMVWRYLTLPPFYLFLASSALLYALLVLQPFPPVWHLLLGMPFLLGLLALLRFAQRRQSATLAGLLYGCILLLLTALLGWSLYHANPSLPGLLTPLAVLALLSALHALLPEPPLPLSGATAPHGYATPALSTLALAYAPLLTDHLFTPAWFQQVALGLVVFSLLWASWGLHQWRRQRPLPATAGLNSALLGLAVAVGLALCAAPFTLAPGLLLAGGGLTLGLSLVLRARALFYTGLLAWAAAAVLIKLHYFPTPPRAAPLWSLALLLWLLWWWLERRLSLRQRLGITVPPPAHAVPLELLGGWRVDPGDWSSLAAMTITPLAQVTQLAGLAGLIVLVVSVVQSPLEPVPATFLLGALVTVLLAGQGRRLWLLPLAAVLGGLALLSLWPAAPLWWLPLTSGYALALWLAGRWSLAPPRHWLVWLSWQGGYSASGGLRTTDRRLYATTFTFTLLSAILSVAAFSLLTMLSASAIAELATPVLLNLLVATLFFALVGRHYQLKLHSYLCLAASGLLVLVGISGWSGIPLLSIPRLPQTAPLLVIMSLALDRLAAWRNRQPDSLYAEPLYHSAWLLYLLSLSDSLLRFLDGWTTVPWLSLAGLLLFQALVLLPLLRSGPRAALVRGSAFPSLLTLSFITLLRRFDLVPTTLSFCLAVCGWSVLLWTVANRWLLAFNQRWPAWAMALTTWPWLGLLLTVLSVTAYLLGNATLHWAPLSALTLYLLLLLHNVPGRGLAWLAAASLLITGLILNFSVYPVTSGEPLPPGNLALNLLWLNLLLSGELLWQRFAPAWRAELRARLAPPLFTLPWLLLLLALLLFTLGIAQQWLLTVVIWPVPVQGYDTANTWLPIAGLLVLSCLHLYYRHTTVLHAQALLLALFDLWWLIRGEWLTWALLLAGWAALLTLAAAGLARYNGPTSRWRHLYQAVWHWLPPTFAVALLGGALAGWPLTNQTLFSLALLGGLGLVLSGLVDDERGQQLWRAAGLVLLSLLLHALWPAFLAGAPLPAFLPWYALQDLLLAGLIWQRPAWWPWRGLHPAAPALTGLATLAWLLHGLKVLLAVSGRSSPLTLFGGADHAAALATLLLGLVWVIRSPLALPTRSQLAVVLLSLAGLYSRLLWVGLAPPRVWDTTALLGAAGLLLIVQHRWPAVGLTGLTLLLPALALLTVPWQLASPPATLALFASAALYLIQAHGTERRLPLYLALLAVNLGLYLWVPALAGRYELLQVYTIPAALSVLLMVELHRQELSPAARQAVRLAALATLYASAALDAFLRPELGIFLLALGLGLAGVLLGIALRLRAFLYTGTLFLVLNVLGQLLRFYPEDRLGRAVILMLLGGLITAAMIVFNIQREAILQRVRILRADLERWD